MCMCLKNKSDYIQILQQGYRCRINYDTAKQYYPSKQMIEKFKKIFFNNHIIMPTELMTNILDVKDYHS